LRQSAGGPKNGGKAAGAPGKMRFMDIEKLRVDPHKFKLKKRDPDETFGVSKAEATAQVGHHVERLEYFHELLYAEHKRALLIVLQGMDASGKDGTIKHVMSGVNPQGCSVTSFKEPTKKELDHDFLWRVHAEVPGKGAIGIFNRSHYEDVLVARVHHLVPRSVWEKRYDQINAFETILAENSVCILKFFLHISSEEQEKRLLERLADPRKNWKMSAADFRERQYWNDYQDAYEDALTKCAQDHAPWYVIPANHKWFRNYAVAEVIIQTLESFRMTFPKVDLKELGIAAGGEKAAGQ
jgi:PPK2 family polyphosphate:nucleotide phosphotransferase